MQQSVGGHQRKHHTHESESKSNSTLNVLQVSEEEGFAEPSSKQLSFTLRLFDLNQDGTLTTDEMLTSLAMDSVVSETAARCAASSQCSTPPHTDSAAGRVELLTSVQRLIQIQGRSRA
eukprot:363626-Chlamydomonas_euryale.AAC.8